MLPAGSRLRASADFAATVRRSRGARARDLLVVHVVVPAEPSGSARAGLVVSRAVGSAVRRNQVKRRLRHLLAARLPQLPDGTAVVVRALPAAATASFAALGTALDAALGRALERAR